MKNQFIKDLKQGSIVDSVFLLFKKTVKKKKNGEDYCMLSFQDKTGSIDGVIWTEACSNLNLLKKGSFEEGSFVKIQGSVSDYKGSRQLEINRLVKLSEAEEKELSGPDFIRMSKRDPEEMFTELKGFAEGFKSNFLKILMDSFLKDTVFVEKFCFSPAAVQYHHAYAGGLLEHTLSMVKICDFLAKNYENIDRDLLITGAILHDVGKITEYATEKSGALIKITDEGKLLGHITIGYGIVLKRIEAINNFPPDTKDRLLHIILSHHGHKEFGSPKRPKTLEAFLVYHVDHMDADIGGFNNILENSDAGVDWSEYLKNFERSVFLKAPESTRGNDKTGIDYSAADDKYYDNNSADLADNYIDNIINKEKACDEEVSSINIISDKNPQNEEDFNSGNDTDTNENMIDTPGKKQDGLF